jgi:hypothetical protein
MLVNCSGGGNAGGGDGGSVSASATYDCCINQVHFSCPNQTAFDQCAQFGQPDPSACTKQSSPCPSQGGQCKKKGALCKDHDQCCGGVCAWDGIVRKCEY